MTLVGDIAAEVARVSAVVTVPVTGEPRDALNAKGGVAIIIDPPTRDYVQQLQTWQLVIIRNHTDLGMATTTALSAVLAELEASDLPIEEARPGARRLSPERPAVPAYFIRYTTA